MRIRRVLVFVGFLLVFFALGSAAAFAHGNKSKSWNQYGQGAYGPQGPRHDDRHDGCKDKGKYKYKSDRVRRR